MILLIFVTGQVTIEFHVERETNSIVLHIQDLNVTEKVRPYYFIIIRSENNFIRTKVIIAIVLEVHTYICIYMYLFIYSLIEDYYLPTPTYI